LSGEVVVEVLYNLRVKTMEQLAYTGCYAGFCTNQQVMTREGQTGTVKAFFINGDVMVEILYNLRRKSINDLAQTGGGGGHPGEPGDELSIGSTVYTRNGQKDIVKGLFGYDEVMVEVLYNNRLYKRADLAIEGCARRGFCTGDRVLTTSGQTGTIKGVFLNGREVVVEILYNLQVKSISELARTH
jgi:hypothetical protein